jgi:hypothetical protein
MALVACKECGAEVAGSAKTCPKCGVSYPGGAGQFILWRKTALTGEMYAIQITIDGQPAGEIKKGGSVTFDLLAGDHQVDVRGGGLSNSAVFQIIDGQATRYEMSFSAFGILGGGLKLKPA